MMNMPGRVMEDDTTRTIKTKARFDPLARPITNIPYEMEEKANANKPGEPLKSRGNPHMVPGHRTNI